MIEAAPDAPHPYRNAILDAILREGLDRPAMRFRRVRLEFGQTLLEPGSRVADCLFLESGVASLTCYMRDGTAAGVAIVGPEGMLGLRACLGAPSLTLGATCEAPGDAIAIRQTEFRAALEQSARIERLLVRHMARLMTEYGQSVACARLHPLDQRLARLLLTAMDRTGRELLRTTHDRLAVLLGVQRPSLTVALGGLRSMGLVGVGRGRVWITNRAALERAACECYALVRDG